VVQEQLEHANIAINMEIYSHVMPGMQREAASRLGAVLFGEAAKTGKRQG
jgi:integrase